MDLLEYYSQHQSNLKYKDMCKKELCFIINRFNDYYKD